MNNGHFAVVIASSWRYSVIRIAQIQKALEAKGYVFLRIDELEKV